MAELEKVLKGLECCSAMDGDRCRECPYAKECEEGESIFFAGASHLADDALELLKAQQPRLMTPDDFDNNPMVDENGKLPAWVEYKRYNGVLRPADGWGTINRNWVDGYIDRRFWTSRPTDKQREETPWEK